MAAHCVLDLIIFWCRRVFWCLVTLIMMNKILRIYLLWFSTLSWDSCGVVFRSIRRVSWTLSIQHCQRRGQCSCVAAKKPTSCPNIFSTWKHPVEAPHSNSLKIIPSLFHDTMFIGNRPTMNRDATNATTITGLGSMACRPNSSVANPMMANTPCFSCGFASSSWTSSPCQTAIKSTTFPLSSCTVITFYKYPKTW